MRSASDEREHRRGLVLGLTMAEVLLLLLFLLLLALGAGLARQATKLAQANMVIQGLEPVLKTLSENKQLTPEEIQALAKDMASASTTRSENNRLKSQLSDASRQLEEFKRLQALASEINPNDPPISTLRKGLERSSSQFESKLYDLTRRSELLSRLERVAVSIDPNRPPETTLEQALAQAREAGQAGANAQLGGQIRERVAVLRETEQRLNQRLEATLGPKLATWKAELDPKTLTLRFDQPELLFQQGQAALRPQFET
jgi:chromosome segregation ATPase